MNFETFLTPIKQMMTRSGIRMRYRMRKPMNQITVNFHEMNSYPRFVRINRFQFFNSSASKRDVTSSSIIASMPDLTYSKQSSILKSSCFDSSLSLPFVSCNAI